MANSLIQKVLQYIDDNIYSKITLDDISRIFYFNKDYIMRLFKKELGMTVIEYISKKRIYLSLVSLKNTDYYILKIALKHGFSSQEYYTETFNKIIGVNPNTYRKFTKNDPTLTEQETITIRKNLTDINYQLAKITSYKNNIQNETTKRLSIYH